jgi:hypothetical protein
MGYGQSTSMRRAEGDFVVEVIFRPCTQLRTNKARLPRSKRARNPLRASDRPPRHWEARAESDQTASIPCPSGLCGLGPPRFTQLGYRSKVPKNVIADNTDPNFGVLVTRQTIVFNPHSPDHGWFSPVSAMESASVGAHVRVFWRNTRINP